jgi:hypothetical protein
MADRKGGKGEKEDRKEGREERRESERNFPAETH